MKYYNLTGKGEIKDYIENCFEHNKDGLIEFAQPRMIDRVLNIIGLYPENKDAKLHN